MYKVTCNKRHLVNDLLPLDEMSFNTVKDAQHDIVDRIVTSKCLKQFKPLRLCNFKIQRVN